MPRLFYLLNQAQGQLYKQSSRILHSVADITINQSAALLSLEKNDGATLSELKHDLRINKSSVGALVERMASNVLIVKEIDAQDTRKTRVFLTETGCSKLVQIKTMLKTQNALLTDGFSAEEISVITRFLESTIRKTLNE